MTQSSGKHVLARKDVWIQECLVIGTCFFYFLFKIHPVLILESQPPVFLMDAGFLSESLKIPGGLTDWFSALIMQFWFSDFFSALILSLCLWIVTFLTRKWMEILYEKSIIHTFHLIPALLLYVLFCQYHFELRIVVALILNLAVLVLFIRWTPKQPTFRILLSAAAAIVLFWVTGGAFLTFAVLYGLNELIVKKQILSGFILISISFFLPFIASTFIFLVTLKQAYLHNQVIEDPTELLNVKCSVLGFYLLTFTFSLFIKSAVVQKKMKRITLIPYTLKLGAGVLLLLSGTILLEQRLCNPTIHLVHEINRFVKESRWSDVLEYIEKNPKIVNPIVLYQTNFSLQQSGILLDRMFAYPQIHGTAGLLMDYQWCTSWPEEASNVFWKLGLLSESQHWAHEAFEYKGYTSDLLKRLGMIYMLKGNNEAASRYFVNLRNVPFKNSIAENLIRINTNPSEIKQDADLSHIQACMLSEDVVYRGGPSSSQLELLLKRNPENKMAFEYLMAYYLLDGNLEEIYSNVSKFNLFGNSQFPRYIQEALIFGAAVNQKLDYNQVKNLINPLIFKRFMEYRQIILNHNGNNSIAKQYLRGSFSDTYWYYFMFIKPAAQKLKSQS